MINIDNLFILCPNCNSEFTEENADKTTDKTGTSVWCTICGQYLYDILID